jgi:hypothetical protein
MGRPQKSAYLRQIRHDITVFTKKTQKHLSSLPEGQREEKIEELLPTQGLVAVRLRVPPPLEWVKQLREHYAGWIEQKQFWSTISFCGAQVTWEFIGGSIYDFLFAALDIVEEAETGKISLKEANRRFLCLSIWKYSHKWEDGSFQNAILDLVDWYLKGEKAVQHLRALNIMMRAEAA